MSGSHLQGTSTFWSDVLVATGARHGLVRIAAAGALALAMTLAGGSPFGAEALAEKNQGNSIKDDCKAMGGRYSEGPRGHKFCRAIPIRDHNGEDTGEKFGFGCPPSAGSTVDCVPTSSYTPQRR
jgi:hypothetical protein